MNNKFYLLTLLLLFSCDSNETFESIIESNDIEKIKLARKTIVASQQDLNTKIVIKSMKGAGNKGTEYLFNDEKYEKFIGRTWEMLPLPVRLIGKESLGYNTAMFTLRKLVFGKDKTDPKVDKTDEGLIKKTIKGMFR